MCVVCCIIAMSEIVEYFEGKARFTDKNEADVIRQKLENLVNNILVQVEKRDERFQSSLLQSEVCTKE